MGVLPTVTGRSTALTLDVGDTVMMVSDGALCDGSAWLCDQLTPVSYTHLDVYKRQAQFPPYGLSTAPAAAARHLRCQNAR